MTQQHEEPRREPHDEGFLAIYEKWISESAYVEKVMTRLRPLLAGQKTMLDVGAGTGVFIFLAPQDIAVTAVEPSCEMRRQIKARAEETGRSVRFSSVRWEATEVPERAYDIVLSANSIYRMEPLRDNLLKMYRTARNAILLVMNGRTETGIYGRMRQALRVADIPCRKPPLGHTLADVKRTLDELAIAYEEELVSWTDEVRFATEQEALRHLEAKLGVWITRESADVLLPFFVDGDDGLTLEDDITMAFLTIRI